MALKKVTKKEDKTTTKTSSKRMTKAQMLKEQIAFLERHNPTSPELETLRESLARSKRGKSSKVKGANYERTVAKKFKSAYNIELTRTPQSGGFAKKSSKADNFRGDITTVDKDIDLKLHIECKDHSTIKMLDWIGQAEEDCPEGKVPLVVFHKRQKNKDGVRVQESGDYVCLRLEDFLSLVEKDKVVVELK